MYMQLSDRGKKMVILLLLFFCSVLAAIYYFAYMPFARKLAVLQKDVQQLQSSCKDTREKIKNREKILADSKYVKYELKNIREMFPDDLLQDKVLSILQDFQDGTEIIFSHITFAEDVAPFPASGKSEHTVANRQDSAKDKQAEQCAGIQMLVKVQYRDPLHHIMDLINGMNNYKDKIGITRITVSDVENGGGQGELELIFYGIHDNSSEEENDAVENSGTIIKNQYFQAQPFDFYLLLSPYGTEVPSVLMEKCKGTNSKIFSDHNALTDVELHLMEQNGKYYYKYRTDMGHFPEGEGRFMEFIPFLNEAIIMRIYSKPRVDSGDQAGANLQIYNDTDKNLRIRINGGQDGARAHIDKRSGSITIEDD